ncbi:hypothetical protein JW906_08265 [bacterium]|nr:hypothetical protein [bacterium]
MKSHAPFVSEPILFPDVQIPLKDVQRRIGYPPGVEMHGGIQTIFDNEVAFAYTLFEPMGIYSRLKIKSCQERAVIFRNSDFVLESRQVSRLLDGCTEAVLFMVTIGGRLELELISLLDEKETTRAFILDAIGSETADTVADQMHWHYLKEIAQAEGMEVTPRFSPGYGDWLITMQSEIHKACNGSAIGISVTESSLMIPRKSVSAVVGMKKGA